MRFAIHDCGRITRMIEAPSRKCLIEIDARALDVADDVLPMTHFIQGGAAVLIPPSPGSGWEFDYAAGQWRFDTDAAWALIRRERDSRLAASDWVTLRAQEQGEAVPPEWLAYRQALRDVTEQADPLAIVWPAPPA